MTIRRALIGLRRQRTNRSGSRACGSASVSIGGWEWRRDAPEAGWTGRHDANGKVFPASEDGLYAWSAAFVSYVMRIAGAGARLPVFRQPFRLHRRRRKRGNRRTSGWLIVAERPEAYAPRQGDLICFGRGNAHELRYDDLPATHFPGHCDIVVDTAVAGQIGVVGGNVDDAVTLKHVPVTPDGRLATADGQVLDARYPWMVVLRLAVGAPVASPASTVDQRLIQIMAHARKHSEPVVSSRWRKSNAPGLCRHRARRRAFACRRRHCRSQ